MGLVFYLAYSYAIRMTIRKGTQHLSVTFLIRAAFRLYNDNPSIYTFVAVTTALI